MATLVLAGSGTLGDHLPLVGLGRRLAERGHRVRAAFNQAMGPYAERAGLEVVPLGRPLGPRQARQSADHWDHWRGPVVERLRWTEADDAALVADCRALQAACQRADLLVAPANDLSGPLVHELLGLPWVTAALTPAFFASQPERLDAPLNQAEGAYLQSLAEHLARVRRRLGLPDRPLARQLDGRLAARILLASSATFCPPRAGQYGRVEPTGFWLYDDPAWASWRPSARLLRFAEREPAPLVLTFSSLPLADPAAVLAIHARAAVLLGRRLIVQRGWASFGPRHLPNDLPDGSVRFVGALPHDWLFERAAAAILHGGIGSLARALHAGCPVAVEPYGNDQFYNARQVLALGLGAALHPHRLTAEGLARILAEKVLVADCRARVEAFGARLRAEDGLTRACDLIEGWLQDP
jgi:UDP:flavonoid glycosyltransferase YjiC (YdhE family)